MKTNTTVTALFLTSFIFLMVWSVPTQAIQVSSGTIETIKRFNSKFVTARDVHIWLPDNYNKKHRYAVFYMHDGQMLFDAKVTWNKQEWGVDETAQKLIDQGSRPFIVVGVNNGGSTRHSDYFPQKPFNWLSQDEQKRFDEMARNDGSPLFSEQVNSDNYLKFLVEELKPYIDANYSVDTTPESTFVMGSSMGGLISLYALGEYPDVFGGAACLSTHWPGFMPHKGNPVPEKFNAYLKQILPRLTAHKLYFDYGDQTLDAHYPPLQKQVDKILQSSNLSPSKWQSLFFKGHAHEEKAWRSRLSKPMTFLLSTTK